MSSYTSIIYLARVTFRGLKGSSNQAGDASASACQLLLALPVPGSCHLVLISVHGPWPGDICEPALVFVLHIEEVQDVLPQVSRVVPKMGIQGMSISKQLYCSSWHIPSDTGGIGLLPLLKSIHRHTELKNFAGQTLGVDAYGWLHRGTISCAIELAQGKPTRK